jgi:hypothetical protein
MAAGGIFQKVIKVAGDALPLILKKTGLPQKWADALGAHGNFWTGLLLGAGGALLAGGAVLGAVAGGTLIAPGVVGTVLLHGCMAAAAMTVGGVLVRAGAQSMGIDLLGTIGKWFGKNKDKTDGADHSPSPMALEQAGLAPAFATRALARDFKQAKVRHKIESHFARQHGARGPRA